MKKTLHSYEVHRTTDSATLVIELSVELDELNAIHKEISAILEEHFPGELPPPERKVT